MSDLGSVRLLAIDIPVQVRMTQRGGLSRLLTRCAQHFSTEETVRQYPPWLRTKKHGSLNPLKWVEEEISSSTGSCSLSPQVRLQAALVKSVHYVRPDLVLEADTEVLLRCRSSCFRKTARRTRRIWNENSRLGWPGQRHRGSWAASMA